MPSGLAPSAGVALRGAVTDGANYVVARTSALRGLRLLPRPGNGHLLASARILAPTDTNFPSTKRSPDRFATNAMGSAFPGHLVTGQLTARWEFVPHGQPLAGNKFSYDTDTGYI